MLYVPVFVCIWDVFIVDVYVFFWLCVFFFFKQKTAYEMRISDWSSDVCSSDLTGKPFQYSISGGSGHFALSAMKGAIHAIAPAIERPSRLFQSRFGRASCRERVCQYV